MLKAEQIPDKVLKAAVNAWKKDDQSFRPNAKTIAAAINAWPGAVWRESGVGREIVSRRIVLPLPPEKEPEHE